MNLVAHESVQLDDLLGIVGNDTHARIDQTSRRGEFRIDARGSECAQRVYRDDRPCWTSHEPAPCVVEDAAVAGAAESETISGSRRYSRIRNPRGLRARSCSSFEGAT